MKIREPTKQIQNSHLNPIDVITIKSGEIKNCQNKE